jgi:hypothetical protein
MVVLFDSSTRVTLEALGKKRRLGAALQIKSQRLPANGVPGFETEGNAKTALRLIKKVHARSAGGKAAPRRRTPYKRNRILFGVRRLDAALLFAGSTAIGCLQDSR